MIDTILTRRSIRKFKNKPVEEESIKTMLKCAMAAPSAGNEQPWHFIVINDRETLNKIPDIHPYARMVLESPLVIVVCGEMKLEKYKDRIPLDCSAATQNILLAAHELGLGAVWVGIYPENSRMDALSGILNIPDGVIPISLIAVGYPDEKKERSDRYKEDRIHFNKFI
jgi:nitroreductase